MGKKSKSKYDKDFIAAQNKVIALGERQLDFTQSFYEQYVAPLLKTQLDATNQATTQFSTLFDMNMQIMRQQQEMYNKYGIPAEQRWYAFVESEGKQAEDFYKKWTRPAAETYIEQLTGVANQATKLLKEGALPAAAQFYRVASEQVEADREFFNKYGRPAVKSYFEMVDAFSSPAYAEQLAAQGMADVALQAQNQRAALRRQLAARGISPDSGAALALESSLGTQEAAAKAAAATQARMAAEDRKIALRSDAARLGMAQPTGVETALGAAQFGRGETLGLQAGQAASQFVPFNQAATSIYGAGAEYARGGLNPIAAFGQGAGAFTASNLAGLQSAIGATNQAAQVPITGLFNATSAYSDVANKYLERVRQDLQIRAMNAQGLGKFLGTALGVGLSFVPGGQTAAAGLLGVGGK